MGSEGGSRGCCIHSRGVVEVGGLWGGPGTTQASIPVLYMAS